MEHLRFGKRTSSYHHHTRLSCMRLISSSTSTASSWIIKFCFSDILSVKIGRIHRIKIFMMRVNCFEPTNTLRAGATDFSRTVFAFASRSHKMTSGLISDKHCLCWWSERGSRQFTVNMWCVLCFMFSNLHNFIGKCRGKGATSVRLLYLQLSGWVGIMVLL